MFVEWDFLLAEIWVLLALAALIGLIGGWLIWGARADTGADANEVRRLRAELDRAKAQNRASLDDIPPMEGGGYSRPVPTSAPAAAPVERLPEPPEPIAPTPTPAPTLAPTLAAMPTTPTPTPAVGTKPEGLSEARDGLPDDLTQIKGVGAKMEKLCNRLGFWHFDQIATWTDDEVAWVDENLEGFKGRVTRDKWVEQAKALAKNETPAFVRRRD